MSEIKVDTLTGKTTAGDITVTSEGGAATMQLQQGLAKVWINFNGTGTIAIRDSYAVTSIVDDGTGTYTTNFSNAMSNINYSVPIGGATPYHTAAGDQLGLVQSPTSTSSVQLRSATTGSFYDTSIATFAIHGSLA
jgi:hypothetical protein